MLQYKITWGTDPEAFLFTEDDEGASQLVPAYEITNGTKELPVPIVEPDSMEGWQEYEEYKMQADGPAIEFTVPPSNDILQMMERVSLCKGLFEQRFRNRKIYIRSDDETSWKSGYLQDPRFATIGCDPDRDSYMDIERKITSESLPRSPSGRTVTRSAGGHIHIGIDPWPEIPKVAFVRLISDRWAYHCMNGIRDYGDKLTYHLYRLNGLYREKDYGVEFRSPGASFLMEEGTRKPAILADWASDVELLVKLISGNRVGEVLEAYRRIDWAGRVAVGRHQWSRELDKIIKSERLLGTQGRAGRLDNINLNDLINPAFANVPEEALNAAVERLRGQRRG